MRRVLRPGFFQKVSRTSVVEHYGLKTLMYGALLPGPDIGAQGRRRDARDRATPASNAASIRWDHVYWQDNVRGARSRLDRSRRCRRATQRFIEIFGEAARHASARPAGR